MDNLVILTQNAMYTSAINLKVCVAHLKLFYFLSKSTKHDLVKYFCGCCKFFYLKKKVLSLN